MEGKKFGYLTVIELAGKTKGHDKLYRCICDCGNETVVASGKIKSGHTKSCGCLMKRVNKEMHWKHGHAKDPLHRTWSNMKTRCYNLKNKSFKDYGSRGIKVCDEWLNDFQAFYDWAMSNGYAAGLTIDRIDVNGNYEPSNCRWVTRKVQNNNRTNTIFIEAFNEVHTVSEWAEITGLSLSCIYKRYRKGCTGNSLFEGRRR